MCLQYPFSRLWYHRITVGVWSLSAPVIPSAGDSIDFSHLGIRRPSLCPIACECVVAPTVRNVKANAFRITVMMMEIPESFKVS